MWICVNKLVKESNIILVIVILVLFRNVSLTYIFGRHYYLSLYFFLFLASVQWLLFHYLYYYFAVLWGHDSLGAFESLASSSFVAFSLTYNVNSTMVLIKLSFNLSIFPFISLHLITNFQIRF